MKEFPDGWDEITFSQIPDEIKGEWGHPAYAPADSRPIYSDIRKVMKAYRRDADIVLVTDCEIHTWHKEEEVVGIVHFYRWQIVAGCISERIPIEALSEKTASKTPGA